MEEITIINLIELSPTQENTAWALQMAETIAQGLDPSTIAGREAELACREIRALATTHLPRLPGRSIAEMAALVLEARGGSWETLLLAAALSVMQKPLIVEPSAVAINDELAENGGKLSLRGSAEHGGEVEGTIEATGELLALPYRCVIAKVFDASEGHLPGGSIVVIPAGGPDAGRKVRVPSETLWMHWPNPNEALAPEIEWAPLKRQVFPPVAL